MELVYKNFEKVIEIFPNKYLKCSNKYSDYVIICEYRDEKRYFFRVVWNIDNGFNTKETIQKAIDDIVEELRSDGGDS